MPDLNGRQFGQRRMLETDPYEIEHTREDAESEPPSLRCDPDTPRKI